MDKIWEIETSTSDTNGIDGKSLSNDSTGDEVINTSEHGATVYISLVDGRYECRFCCKTPPYSIFIFRLVSLGHFTILSVCPVPGVSHMFYIRLHTSHYSFSIKNSCVIRSRGSFYQLRRILKVNIFTEINELILYTSEPPPVCNHAQPAHVTLALDLQLPHHLFPVSQLPLWCCRWEWASI